MAKKISLQLEINGVKQSVSNIDQLEKTITDLKNKLKGVDIGSEEFKKLSGEIRKAQNFAEDLNESLKPQELEKRVGAYAKVGSAIVSSFAAAQATISLFGEESEDVAKAAAKAQAVLTIALTAREAAEGLVALKTVAANIATVASAAAANTANVATRALYTTLASNPYGAILTVVGAVAGALIYFGDSEEEVVDVTKELNTTLSDSAVALKSQLRVLQDANTTEDTRLGLIKDLNKEYPGFNAFVDEENRLTKEGITFLNLRIKQYESEARIKFILNKILAAEQKQIELTNEDVEAQISLWDELYGAIKAVGTLSPGESARVTAIREQTEGIIEQQTQINELNVLYEKEIENLKGIELQIAAFQKQLDAQVETENKSKKTKEELQRKVEELNKAYKEGQTSLIELSTKYKEVDDAAKRYQETLDKLSKQAPASTTLQDLQNFIKFREELLKTIQPLETFRQKIQESFGIPKDSFEQIFKPLRTGFEEIKTQNIDLEEKVKKYNELYQGFLKNNTTLTQSQKDAVANLLDGYVKFEQFVQKTPGLKKFIEEQKNISTEFKKGLGFGMTDLKQGLQETLYLFGEIGLAYGKLTVDFSKEGKLTEIAFDPKEAQKNSEEYFNNVRKSLFIPIGVQILETTKKQLEFQQSLKKGTPEFAKLGEEIKRVQSEIEKFGTTGILDPQSFTNIQAINDEVNKQVELYKSLILSIVGYEDQILISSKKIDDAFARITSSIEETSRAQGQLIAQNIQAILPQIYGPMTKAEREMEKQRDKARKDVIGLEKFKLNLQNQGLGEQIKNNEDLLDAYIAFKQKEVDATKEAEDEKQQAIKDTFQEISQYTQLFSQTLGQIATLSRESIQNQLDFLQKSTDAQLEQVVGDTESAEKKREEIRTRYAQQREELEKKQTISSLKFSLVQAVANAAQAITSIFAQLGGTPLAFIQSAIVAGLTTAEIAIINEQINTAQMFRRGGLLKAQGGMLLSGPTHEQGGIPLAQMGVIAEGQEAIINRNSLINYRDLLSTVNQAGGGRPLVVNSFDDTRIVEAIASQRQKPLRAYVLQSEITNEQALSKRLDDLSKI